MKRFALLFAAVLCAPSLPAADRPNLDELLRDSFTYRNLGPFRAGSWVPDIAVPETPLKDHLYTFYVAARNGGVWKTTNNGTTFQPLFDGQDFLSIGALAIAPSDANIVWVGTATLPARGASSAATAFTSPRTPASPGSTWGWWKPTISRRIVMHPKNPDIVYVAAMGHLFSPTNEERGVFKTTDGGKTWKKILYLTNALV